MVLVVAGHWNGSLAENTAAVAAKLVEKRTSAELVENNPFSLSFMSEGIRALQDVVPAYPSRDVHYALVHDDFANHLVCHLNNEEGQLAIKGSISIFPYPPSAYLTQLVHRVLKRLSIGETSLSEDMHRWSRNEINKQIALIGAGSRTSDPLQLAYALILATSTLPDELTSPEDKEIFSHALDVFFARQLDDGSWPLSRPMFHYAGVGNAYCFDYELLVQLLSCKPLRDDLLRHLPKLERALTLATRTSYELEPDVPGQKLAWASGHHPQLPGPESWSTASVYHFAHALDRLIAEGVRRALFQEIGEAYPGPPTGPTKEAQSGTCDFASSFLDADLIFEGDTLSFRETLANRFVKPIARSAGDVGRGGKLAKDAPMSAILFGPPGTSKTQLAKLISDYLGWPLIVVDPSYLVQKGLDQVQAMANRLFGMLATVEEVVVLLDEFDEMGRSRTGNENLLSRFITTAMLPKLIAINDAKKIVFLLATNYVSGFDAAFSREGRFDMRLQVMPPNTRAKLDHAEWRTTLQRVLGLLDAQAGEKACDQLSDLTFLETKRLVGELGSLEKPEEVARAFDHAWNAGTLQKRNDDGTIGEQATKESPVEHENQAARDSGAEPPIKQKQRLTWKETSKSEQRLIRLPPAPVLAAATGSVTA